MQRKVLVTGGSGGIGAAICRKFAEEGCLVYINYRSSQEKAERIAAETGGIAVRFDVSDADAVRRAISEIGAPDVLVNNAGVSEVELFTALTDDRAQRLLETDLIGTMNCARAVLPGMIRRHSGCIVKIDRSLLKFHQVFVESLPIITSQLSVLNLLSLNITGV